MLKETHCETCEFRKEICEVVSANEFEEIFNNTDQLIFNKGEIIFKQGTDARQLAYITKGVVKLEHKNTSDMLQIPGVMVAPVLIGGNYSFTGSKNIFSVVAIEDCHVCLISYQVIRARAMVNPLFGLKIYEMLSMAHQRILEKQLMLACKRVPGRIAGVLIMLCDRIYRSETFSFPLSRREISYLTSCSEENVIRTLSGFDHDGIISLNGKSVSILDIERLHRIYNLG